MPFVERPDLFHLPPGESTIWRYIDFTKFVSLLEKRALYFASVETLSKSDPFEGLYTKANLAADQIPFEMIPEEVRKENPAYADKDTYEKSVIQGTKAIRKTAKTWRAVTFVNSWHISTYESAAMWTLYLKSSEGIAIRSTVNRLRDSFSSYTEFAVFIGAVKYIDFDSEAILMGNPLLPYMHKRRSFEHEKELRAMIFGPQRGKISLTNASPGLYVQTDLDTLIEAVYVAPGAEDWFLELIRSVCSRYGMKKAICQSDLGSKSLYWGAKQPRRSPRRVSAGREEMRSPWRSRRGCVEEHKNT